jgi:GWxTD domain-containing protein
MLRANLKGWWILLFVMILFSLISCGPGRRASNQNVAFLYKKDQISLSPQYMVLHLNDSVSELHFRISSSEVLYAKAAPNEPFSAQVKISYRLFDDYDSHIIFDTASIVIKDVANADLLRDLVSRVGFNAKLGYNYLMEVTCTDLNRNISKKTFINVEKTSSHNRQNFLLLSADTKVPLFRYFLKNNEAEILFNRTVEKPLFVRYYKRDYGIAAPPFAMVNPKPFEYRADSIFTIPVEDNSALINFQNPGFYHIQLDTLYNRDGLTLYKFEGGFPEVKTIDDMLFPLRYVTNKQEYENIVKSEDKKDAIDQFWLNLAGNQDRARELISIFYNRVQDANNLFSSFIEGWKTDRGMIYIVFGPPNIMYKSSDRESWIYGEDNNMMSLNFTFYKVENPFSDNDFTLDRSIIYKNSWYRAVDLWRQGRVY